MDVVPDVANVERYAQIVKEKSMLRRSSSWEQRHARRLRRSERAGDVLNIAEKSLTRLRRRYQQGFVGLDRSPARTLRQSTAVRQSRLDLLTVFDWFRPFQRIHIRFQRQDLSSSPLARQGKTSFMMNIAQAIAIRAKGGALRPGLDRP